jgi:NAD(P)-dependent dehydrogenase (short-subunit alcohol dehydrogenase family)
MDSFAGRLAVVTGGGTGMGRELVIQLAAEGCSVATCDLTVDRLDTTVKEALAGAPAGTRVTAHACDVADEVQVTRFRDEVLAQHDTDHVNLVFNNAGIAGGGSFITGERKEWEQTFAVCWGGVYNCCRVFVPLLIAGDEGVLVNTSSVNGFWASLGPGMAHTAYSTAKFAVKGFTEALLEDFRLNAPHVTAAVVMPGHIGTDIVLNTPRNLTTLRADLARRGMPVDHVSDDDLDKMIGMMGEAFRENAPVSAAEAATIILDGIRAGEWRILVGDDAHEIDAAVRADPLAAYGPNGLTFKTMSFGQ